MSFLSNVTQMPVGEERYDKTGKFNLRTKTYSGSSVSDCLLQAKQEMGADAIIVSKRSYKKGALFGRWGGREVIEMTFGTYLPPQVLASSNIRYGSGNGSAERDPRIEQLEAQINSLQENIQSLNERPSAKKQAPPFVPAPIEVAAPETGQQILARFVAQTTQQQQPQQPGFRRSRKKEGADLPATTEDGYPSLTKQLLDADIAAPLVRQLISEIPVGLATADGATYLRTVLSQRLRLANTLDTLPSHGKMRLLAFVGTTGVGKTTTIAKLTARFALLERRKVGVITLDTQRIGAAEQLQKYGEILRVPVKVAHDKLELHQQLNDFATEGKELVLLDTAGRSPNEMIPLGETAHLFEGVGAVQKYLTIPATLGQRDMENIVTKFQNFFTPDAVILTKLDEASDHTCFGRLLTMQAKFGLPLAYVTTGQKVPDDIVLPDPHAIASRILSSPLI